MVFISRKISPTIPVSMNSNPVSIDWICIFPFLSPSHPPPSPCAPLDGSARPPFCTLPISHICHISLQNFEQRDTQNGLSEVAQIFNVQTLLSNKIYSNLNFHYCSFVSFIVFCDIFFSTQTNTLKIIFSRQKYVGSRIQQKKTCHAQVYVFEGLSFFSFLS